MKISLHKLVVCGIYIICLYIILITNLSDNGVSSKFNRVALISLISFFVFIYARIRYLISVVTFFVLFLYIYNCGQVWLLLFDYNFKYTSFLIINFNLNYTYNAIYYFTVIILVFQLLIELFGKQSDDIQPYNISRDNTKDTTLIIISGLLYVICIIVLFINDATQSFVAISSGYSNAFMIGRDNPIIHFTIYLYPLLSIYTILIYRGWQRKFAISHGLIRSLLMMLIVGNRGQYLALICILFIVIVFTSQKKRKKNTKNILYLGLLGFSMVSIAGYVANIRNVVDYKLSFIQYLSRSNVFLEILQELGGSLVNMILLVKNIPDNFSWGYGISYIGAIVQYFPKMSNVFPELVKYNDLGAVLNTYFEKSSGLGGSFIGELYFNFNWYALLVLPFFVLTLHKIDEIIRRNSSNVLQLGIAYYLAYASFMYTRYNFSEMAIYARYLSYFLLIYYLFNRKSKIKRN